MSRKVVSIVALLLSLPIIVAYRASAPQGKALTILPEDCRMLAGEQIQLSLDGRIPWNAAVQWSVNYGGIVSSGTEFNAIFLAPSESEVVTISVSISSGKQTSETPITRECIVTSTNSVPEGLVETTEGNKLAVVWLGKA